MGTRREISRAPNGGQEAPSYSGPEAVPTNSSRKAVERMLTHRGSVGVPRPRRIRESRVARCDSAVACDPTASAVGSQKPRVMSDVIFRGRVCPRRPAFSHPVTRPGTAPQVLSRRRVAGRSSTGPGRASRSLVSSRREARRAPSFWMGGGDGPRPRYREADRDRGARNQRAWSLVRDQERNSAPERGSRSRIDYDAVTPGSDALWMTVRWRC